MKKSQHKCGTCRPIQVANPTLHVSTQLAISQWPHQSQTLEIMLLYNMNDYNMPLVIRAIMNAGGEII